MRNEAWPTFNPACVSDGNIHIATELQASIVCTNCVSLVTGREQLECVSRLGGHICSIMRICVLALHLVGLHGVPRRITECLHGKEQRSGCIAVGLGKREKRRPGVAKALKCSVRVARAVCQISHEALCHREDSTSATLGRGNG